MLLKYVLLQAVQYRCIPFISHCRRIKLERKLQEDALSEEEKVKQREALQQQERDYFRLQRQRLSSNDFEALKLIGRGAFGEVHSTLELL